MRGFLPFLLALLVATPAFAQQVVVNSADWRDAYTGLQYAATAGMPASFVVDAQQGTSLVTRLGSDRDVLLITGRQQAMPGFRALLQSQGYRIEEIVSRDPIETNHDLARRAPTRSLVVVDDAYGFAAISVGTYARLRNASVVFASDDTQDLVEEKQPEELLLYGHIPGAIYEQLEQYEPDTINEQDRFADNFALVQRYRQFAPVESLILSNGEFLEGQLLVGDAPLLFVGRQNVPDEVIDFIRESGTRVAVLVGNALAPNAQYIKEETGISVFIKFAQGRDEEQFALDLFPVPIPNPLLSVSRAEYDAAQQALLVTYENPGEVATYFSASFNTQDGTYEDAQPVFLEAGTYKTVRYAMPDPGTEVPYVIVFGAFPASLELLLQGTLAVEHVTIDDRSAVAVREAVYDTRAQAFRVTVENTGAVDAYVLIEATDVRIGPERVRIASEVMRIAAGKSVDIALPAELSERDVERNHELSLEVFYGQRAFSLFKTDRATVGVTVTAGGLPTWAIAIAVGAALLVLWIITRRKR